jgi:hypothetical protein
VSFGFPLRNGVARGGEEGSIGGEEEAVEEASGAGGSGALGTEEGAPDGALETVAMAVAGAVTTSAGAGDLRCRDT